MTDIAPLVAELEELLGQIDEQIDELVLQAQYSGIRPTQLRTPHGEFVMADILVAKANILVALANLKGRDNVVSYNTNIHSHVPSV